MPLCENKHSTGAEVAVTHHSTIPSKREATDCGIVENC